MINTETVVCQEARACEDRRRRTEDA